MVKVQQNQLRTKELNKNQKTEKEKIIEIRKAAIEEVKKLKKEGKEQEFEKYLQKIEDPNYQGGSWDLPTNPTALEQAKYDLCERILAHKQDNNLNVNKLAQQVKLSVAETEDILHYRIDHFTLDRLMDYASKLFSPNQVRVTITKKSKKNGSRLYA